MQGLTDHLGRIFGREVLGLLGLLALAVVLFGLTTPHFLSAANFDSIAFQLPDLGLLTLAMLAPIVSNGINLAVIATANLSGLALAWILNMNGGPQAGVFAFVAGVLAALAVGGAAGAVMGATIAYFGAHPILASLAMMIFLRGLGEFLTHGGDISGFPEFLREIGHGSIIGIPVPMLVFIAAAILWHVLLARTRHGFSVAMIGSNPQASEYSGIPVKRSLTLVYALSGVMCALAGVIMLTRFNSVRVGHGEALLLVTVLACFLGG
ncbi:MAG TPA: ABC transporter permease, partial [Roseiarcus sp.]|nr:ABC transporter permease [Roseiarcus sp.]